MTPEVLQELAASQHLLDRARRLYGYHEATIAAREAYLAALHAANAYILARTGKLPRSHSGTRAQLRMLCHASGELAVAHAEFLTEGYEYKVEADYYVRDVVQLTDVPGILDRAAALLAAVEAALRPPVP